MDSGMQDAIRAQATAEACEAFTDDPQGNTDNTIDAIKCGVRHAIHLMVYKYGARIETETVLQTMRNKQTAYEKLRKTPQYRAFRAAELEVLKLSRPNAEGSE